MNNNNETVDLENACPLSYTTLMPMQIHDDHSEIQCFSFDAMYSPDAPNLSHELYSTSSSTSTTEPTISTLPESEVTENSLYLTYYYDPGDCNNKETALIYEGISEAEEKSTYIDDDDTDNILVPTISSVRSLPKDVADEQEETNCGNTTEQTISAVRENEVTVSSLCFNYCVPKDDDNEEMVWVHQGISDDDDGTPTNIDDEDADGTLTNIDDENDDNLRVPIISSVTSMTNFEEDQADNNLDSCLICGQIQTVEDAKKAASSFQWNINGNEPGAQNHGLSPDTCVDAHLIPIFVLRTLLKFPEEECAKIYRNTDGVLNPADWFILCERCLEEAHNAYTLQVLIRQLEKKFEACQEHALSKVKASVRDPMHNNHNDGISNKNILTVRDQILSFYSDTSSDILFTDSTFSDNDNDESGQSQPCKNHLSDSAAPSSCNQNIWEFFDFNVDNDIPSPEADTSSAIINSGCQNITTDIDKNHTRKKLSRPTYIRGPYITKKRFTTTQLALKLKQTKDKLVARYGEFESPNVFRCKLCRPQYDIEFQSRQSFVLHLASAHKRVWKPETKFVNCDHCGKSVSVNTLSDHVKNDHGAYLHACILDGKRYILEITKKLHTNSHMIEIPRKVCHYCGVECTNRVKLRNHIKRFHRKSRTANGSKGPSTGRARITSQIYCKHCDVVCINLHRLKFHLKKVHPELYKYKCEECDAAYISKQPLQIHVNSIHRKTKLQCKNCSKVLSTAAGMHYHLKKHCRGPINS